MNGAISEGEDVRDGYKRVQLGPKEMEIPEEWEVRRFGDVFQRRRESIEVDENETIRYVGLDDIESDNIHLQDYDENGAERSSDRAFREGDVLFGKLRPYLNKAAVAPFDGICSSDIIPIFATEETDDDFLVYLMHSKVMRDRAVATMSGTNLPRTSWDDIASGRFPCPSLPEQRHIAAVLSAVDEEIRQTKEIINNTKELQKGLLDELIPRGIINSGELRPSPEERPESYKEVKRCTIPTDWAVSSLQDLCSEDVTYGIVQAGPHVEDGVPYIKTGDMTDGQLEIEKLSRTSKEIAEDYDRSEVQAGELVITIRATVGVVKQVPPELDGANLTQGTARISPDDSVENRYLLWAIRSNLVQSLIEARTKGSTFNEITLSTLRKVPIPHPASLDEQKRIADKLDTVEEKSHNEQSYLDGLKELKRGLMQDLLTGEVRVDSLELPEEK